MASNILTTKLRLPSLPSRRVARPQLIRRLNEGLAAGRQLTLVSAPAGFGKTTCVSEWLHDLPAAGLSRPVAWLSLEQPDNDPGRFFSYLTAAFQKIDPRIGLTIETALRSGQDLPPDFLMTTLLNDVQSAGCPFLLALDDFHVIREPAILRALETLVANQPENLHLVFITREDPLLPLARLRANNQLTEVRAGDLRFTPPEAGRFFNELMQLSLKEGEVAALSDRIEGWVAGLQLAAISLQGRADVSTFVNAFTGSHTYVAAYLLEEVLQRQPEEVQEFLLKTSLLDRFCVDLCDEVIGDRGKGIAETAPDHLSPIPSPARSILNYLERSNLFIIPLDDDHTWFRYHHLFADLLQARLRQRFTSKEITGLHRLAVTWFEQAGMAPEAIEQALSAQDYPVALRLIEKTALPMIMKAYFKTVEDWLQAIPTEYLSENLTANMAFAWMHLMRRNMSQAIPILERLQRLFSTLQQDEIDPALQGEWLAIQSLVLNAQGKARQSCDLAEQALSLLPETETQVRSLIFMSLVDAYQQIQDYDRAAGACRTIVQQSRLVGDLASESLGLSLLGRMLLQQGLLHAAYEVVTEALQRIERLGSFSPFTATFYGEYAQIYYDWHQLEKARGYFMRSVELSSLGGFSDAEIYFSVFLSRLFQMEGDLPASIQEIEKALNLMRTAAPALVIEEVISQQVNVCLSRGRIPAAQEALKPYGFIFEAGFSFPEIRPGSSLPHAVGLLYVCALRILLFQAKTDLAPEAVKRGIKLADMVIDSSLQSRQLPIVLKTLLLRGQLQALLGNDQIGLADIAKALELAQPEGFISLFVEEGAPVAVAVKTLIAANRPATLSVSYLQEIIAAFPKTNAQAVPPVQIGKGSRGSEESGTPVESLTPRELEVLGLIAAGDSNRDIAEKLVITVSAVKKHTGNIFGKLGVNSRTQAVAQARQLGLL